jgi:adenylosuccinate lyase
MMRAVKNGGDRQELHERIRVHSIAAGAVVKEQAFKRPCEPQSGRSSFGLTEDE